MAGDLRPIDRTLTGRLMVQRKRSFVPFSRIMVPILDGCHPGVALEIAQQLTGKIQLIGLIPVPGENSLSLNAGKARLLRRQMSILQAQLAHTASSRLIVSHTPWQDLVQLIMKDPPDLLILEWPQVLEQLKVHLRQVLAHPPCPLAIVRGPWPETLERVLVPVRGGPNAELAVRFGLALPHKELVALHISKPGPVFTPEPPFRGLERVLTHLKEVNLQVLPSNNPLGTIQEWARQSSVLFVGASTGPDGDISLAERLFNQSTNAMAILAAARPTPQNWTGAEGERAGTQAISLLVDRWFSENTYHVNEFEDLNRLVRLKEEQGLTISLALPALNEEKTVGKVIQTVQESLVSGTPLLDEIVLIDSDSTDQTREVAASLGVPVFIHQQLLSIYGSRRGKGEALWKSLMVTKGDIVIWIDTDIVNIHPRFVYGVIGPLLVNPNLQFIKGFYQRPLKTGDIVQSGAGGRVTELTARPLLNLFFPELSGVIQPLSGEYGGRRSALEQCSFFSGYGVEIGLLIEIFERFGLGAIGQVDLLERVHHNQSLEALSKMSFTIQQAVLHKLEHRLNRPFLEEVNKSMKLIHFENGNYYLDVEEVVERERPPMLELPEYRLAHTVPAGANLTQ